jgi:hypothetical protein
VNQPKLVWFDEQHLQWKDVKWWKILPFYIFVLIVWATFFYLAGNANAKTLVKTEYEYFPCARTLEKQEGGGTHWVWVDIHKAMEKAQFQKPIQLIINK